MELLTSLSLLSFLFLHLFLFSLLRLLYTRRGPSPVHRCHHFSLFLFGQFTKKKKAHTVKKKKIICTVLLCIQGVVRTSLEYIQRALN